MTFKFSFSTFKGNFPETPAKPSVRAVAAKNDKNKGEAQLLCDTGIAAPTGIQYDVEWWSTNYLKQDTLLRKQQNTTLPAILKDEFLPDGFNVDVSRTKIA